MARLSEFIPKVPLPGGVQHYEWTPINISDRVTRALSIENCRAVTDTIHMLSDMWGSMHETIDHFAKPDWDEDDHATPDCKIAGMCICCGPGIEVGVFVAKLNVALKRA
eukprot:5871749-Pyramimonas_sp.AAC.1